MTITHSLVVGAGGGGGKGGGAQARTPQITKDSLDSTQYATVLDLISEGEISGLKNGLASIFLNNTPLASSAKTGTFTRATVSSPLVITINNHGYTNGQQIYVDASTNSPCFCTVANATTNTFTVSEPVAQPGIWWTGNVTTYIFNFQNVTVYTRNGTQSQSYIPIGGVSNTVSVGSTVTQSGPATRTITDTAVNRVKVTITVPTLQEQKTNGDVVGSSFELQIAVQYNGGGYVTVLSDTFTGRTSDTYQREYNVPLTGAFPVDVRVIRVTADSTDPLIVNAFNWSSYTEITDAKLRYPNTALVGLRIDAEQFSSIPERSYLVRGIKVRIPSNGTVDSTTGRITYAGVWNGTFGAAQWTSDPAWCLYDLLTSTRYGFGDHITDAQLDKWAFYAASQYCSTLVPNGFGGTEPRFSCNTNIQTSEEAYTLINSLASVFRAMPFWSAGALTISQDRPADPAYLFTLANVTEEGFSYENSSRKGRPTVAVVKYLDLNTRDVAYEVVEDQAAITKYGVVTTQVDAFACTSRGQAARVGEWLLYSEQYEGEIVTFTASIDAGVIVRPGQIIEISDPVRAGSRRGGRIRSATTSAIVVDDATGLPASGGTLSVILPDGTVQSRTVGTRSGTTVPVTSNFTTAPNANSIWIWETNDLQASTWRVLGIQEQDGINYAVSAIAYNASKYAYIERGAALTQRDVSNLNELPAAPTNLVFSEELYRYQDQVRAKVIAKWRPVLGVNEYSVQYRKDNGNWTTSRVQGPDFEVLDITPGVFEFRIYSLNAAGKQSTLPLSGSITALGKTAPPANVANFAATIDPNIGVLFSWSAVSDIDVAGYEIRKGGSAWGTGDSLVTKVTATTYKLGLLEPSTATYRIKAIDTSGVYSSTAAALTVTIAAPSAVQNLTTTTADDIATLTWTAPATGSYAIRAYAIIYSGNTIAESNTTSFSIPITWTGARTYTIKPVDIAANEGPTTNTTITVVQAAAPVITATFQGENAVLSWAAVNGTTKTRAYQILDGATTIATIQTTTYTKVVDWQGSKTFTIRAVDANGNVGADGTVVVNPTVPSTPTFAAATYSGAQVVLSWTNSTQSLPINNYEIRYGVDFDTGTLVTKLSALSLAVTVNWTGARSFHIRATDTAGNVSAVSSISVSPTAPPTPSFNAVTYDGPQAVLTWAAVSGSLPTVSYVIKYGASYDTGTLVATTDALRLSLNVNWTGSRTLWIKAFDSSGNSSATAGTVVVSPSVPSTVGGGTASFVGAQLVLSWTANTVSSTQLPISAYEVRYGASFAAGSPVATLSANSLPLTVDWTGARLFWVQAIDTAGNVSSVAGTDGRISTTVSQAGAPAVIATYLNNLLQLNWGAVEGSLPTTEYEIRVGATYATSTFAANAKTTNYKAEVTWTSGVTYWVTARSSNNVLGTPASVAVPFALPPASPKFDEIFRGEQVELKWDAVQGSLETENYEIRQTDTAVYNVADTPIATIKSTSFKLKVTWLGTKYFWVTAVDVKGNRGTAAFQDVTVSAPTAPTVSSQVIDNNVLLRWDNVTNTLPILYYNVYRGVTLVGTKQGLFTTVFETVSGSYTYTIRGVDSAGNEGAAGSITAIVNQPPDYILRTVWSSTFAVVYPTTAITKTNTYVDGTRLIVSADTAETWQSHFVNPSGTPPRNWSTIQDQINAGFPRYIMPTPTTASYSETFDYGTVLAGTKISASFTSNNIAGTVTTVPTLSTSTNGTTWTDYAGLNEVYATNFRYVKVTYNYTSAGGDDIMEVTAITVRLDVKIRNDAGSGTANSGDVGGTTVNFTVPFIDVESISVTPSGTTPRIAIYDFVDAPNPTSFKVLLFDTSGNRVTGPFSWSARGT